MRIGVNPERDVVEIVELPNHPWFVGVQYHPELKPPEPSASAVSRVCQRRFKHRKNKKENRRYAKSKTAILIYENLFTLCVKIH